MAPDFAQQLRDRLGVILAQRRIAGSGVLDELAEDAQRCTHLPDKLRSSVAYVLMCAFERFASVHENSQIPSYTADRFFMIVSRPFTDAADFVLRGGSNEEAMAIVSSIAHAENLYAGLI